MATPRVEISHATFEGAKVAIVKVVVGCLPFLLNRLRAVTSKIVKATELSTDNTSVEPIPYRIPFHTTLPVVVVSEPILSTLPHDTLGNHT